MRARPLILCLILSSAVGLLVAFSGSAATLDYQSQTGTVSASGSTPTLPVTSQSLPISGLSDVNLVASVANSDASSSYNSLAQLQTTLGADQFQVIGDSTAVAAPVKIGATAEASADANVSVLFNLDAPTTLQIRDVSSAGGRLQNLDLGFAFFLNPALGGNPFASCGSFSAAECDQLFAAFSSEALFPAGHYQIDVDFFAFQPQGSCNAGCGSSSGTVTLATIPEPTTGLLVMAGVLGLAVARRIRM